jgi:hypothetical protein
MKIQYKLYSDQLKYYSLPKKTLLLGIRSANVSTDFLSFGILTVSHCKVTRYL